MRRALELMIIGAAAMTVAGCLTLMPVGSHFQRGTDFTRYQTYAWGPADALPISDQRLRENPYFVDDVHGAIDWEFQDRGLRHATSERADLLVHYHAAVNSRLEVQSRVAQFRDCVGEDCRGTVSDYDAGTLVIDVIDTRTQQLVWRGWAEHRLEDMLDDPQAVHRRVKDAVHRIMKTLPLTIQAYAQVAAPEVTP